MTEAETLEVVALYGSNSFSIFTVYLSITFAYLTVAYFLGAKLSRFQTITISGLYIASSAMASLAFIGTTQTWVVLISTTQTMLNTIPIYSAGVWHIYAAILAIAGILVSLYFMYDVRRPRNGQEA